METTDVAQLQKEVIELRTILQQHPDLFKSFYKKQCVEALAKTTLFSEVPEKYLKLMSDKAVRVEYPTGHYLCLDGSEVDRAYIIASGDIRRWATADQEGNGGAQQVNTFCDNSVGTLHLYNVASAARYNAECATPVVAYCLTRSDLDQIIAKNPEVSHHIIRSLSKHIRAQSKRYVTPLFETRGHKTTLTATSIAACVESFFRSAMASLINQKVTGVATPLFPNMHLQVPVRVTYLNGLKGIRSLVEEVDCDQHMFPTASRAALSFLPGVVMCPFSSVLEASNMTESKTPMATRWVHGIVPRFAREIVFALGINQATDFVSERFDSLFENEATRHAAGSVTAGLIAGYFSHIPHVISTMKLSRPDLSYYDHWKILYRRSEHLVPPWLIQGSTLHRTTAQFLAVAAPIGMVRRSTQIAGTFMLVNGITYSLRNQSQNWY